jgi:hypothetical protein
MSVDHPAYPSRADLRVEKRIDMLVHEVEQINRQVAAILETARAALVKLDLTVPSMAYGYDLKHIDDMLADLTPVFSDERRRELADWAADRARDGY